MFFFFFIMCVLGGGWYVWADSSPGAFRDTTELYTPMIRQTGPQCKVVLYYWMQGHARHSMEIYLQVNNRTEHLWAGEGEKLSHVVKNLKQHSIFYKSLVENQIFYKPCLKKISDDHGTEWQHLEVFIGPRQNFNLFIQARRGRSFTGDLSVDSINFINCQPPIALPQGCPANNFQCNNGYCVKQNLKCDYSNDCGDSSDEIVRLHSLLRSF